MNPTDFPEVNLKLTPPPSMPDCLPLGVHRYPPTFRTAALPDGAGEASTCEPGGYISRWEPTPEERVAIAAGGPVWVYVVGDGAPPPIAVSGVNPFVPAEADPEAADKATEAATGLDPDAGPGMNHAEFLAQRAQFERIAAEDDKEVEREVVEGALAAMDAHKAHKAPA